MDMEKADRSLIVQFGLTAATLIAALCVSRLAAQSIDSWGAAPLAVGQPAPPMDLRTLGGSPVDLATMKNKITVLIYTSEKCAVSADYRARIANLAELYLNDPRLGVMEINGDVAAGRLSRKQLADLVQRQHVNHPVLIDAAGRFVAEYGTTVTPTCYIIGPEGMLRYSGTFDDSADAAKVTHRYVADAIRRLLDGSPVEITTTQPFGCGLKGGMKLNAE
jgi:peroxiredoxin